MPRFTNKWLSLLLALLLGMVPFGQAISGILSMADTTAAAHLSAMSHDGHMSQATMDGKACDSCSNAHPCGSSGCACYQCGTCSATLLHELLTLHFASLAAPYPTNDISLITHHPFLLFRPPRT